MRWARFSRRKGIDSVGRLGLTLTLFLILGAAALWPRPSFAGADGGTTNINITIGGAVFPAKLYGNDTAKALLAQLPMTLRMADLNGNEKYRDLAKNLPAGPLESPAVINAGDIMCWSGNCLVLFYKTFSNSFGGYVRLGRVENVSGLASALGSGAATVTFSVSD